MISGGLFLFTYKATDFSFLGFMLVLTASFTRSVMGVNLLLSVISQEMCDLTVEFLKTVPFFCHELCEHLVCDNFPTYFILHRMCPYLGCPVYIHPQ
jgi:hypothetical protein